MIVEQLRTDSLIPYARNPRINDHVVSGLAASIKEFGFQQPIVIDKDNVIVAGHTRLKAAQQLGLAEVPCVRAADLSEQQVKAFRILDNKIAERSTWDAEMLALELDEIELDLEPFEVDFDDDLALGDDSENSDEIDRATLAERFLVPPFTVLDARQGYWQDRKRAWLSLGIQSEMGRGGIA